MTFWFGRVCNLQALCCSTIVSVFAYVQAFNLYCQELVKIKHEQYANL